MTGYANPTSPATPTTVTPSQPHFARPSSAANFTHANSTPSVSNAAHHAALQLFHARMAHGGFVYTESDNRWLRLIGIAIQTQDWEYLILVGSRSSPWSVI